MVAYHVKHLQRVIFVVLVSRKMMRLYSVKKYVYKQNVVNVSIVNAMNAKMDFNLMN